MRPISDRFYLYAVLAAIVAAVLYLPGLGGGFLFDDRPNIVYNTGIQIETLSVKSLSDAIYSFAPSGYHRILPELTFALDYWRAGLDPGAFKATNILIHFLTVLAFAGFFRQLLLLANYPPRKAALLSVFIALLWAIHPIQVSSVLYVVQRMQTMGTLFVVLSLWFYLKMRSDQISGAHSRQNLILFVFSWLLALACKEDSALVPVYTLALELTVLQFQSATLKFQRRLKNLYGVFAVAATLLYLFVVAPHFWSHEAYPGRSFNSLERLLSQGRALALYLGQIVWPQPSHFAFYYDNFEVSRSLLRPITTLPAMLLVGSLLAMAWSLRKRRPLLSLGLMLFFSAHVISSNVIGLELVFEHRNHFALAGIILALIDLVEVTFKKMNFPASIQWTVAVLVVVLLGASTWERANLWGQPEVFVKKTTEIAPGSARAWNSRCGFYYERFEKSGSKAGDTNLDKAISACQAGGKIPYSASALSNVVLFKTIRGDVTTADWDTYIQRMKSAPPSAENTYSIWVMIGAASRGVPLNNAKLVEAIDAVTRRAPMDYVEYAKLGFFILERTSLPDEAFDYFAMSARLSVADRHFLNEVLSDLRRQGRMDWADKLNAISHQSK